jgi:predicted NAD/FAD-dependent oxidoreductase
MNLDTKENEPVEVSFDHAAPFFSAKTSTFRDGLLRDWETRGLAQRWLPRRRAAEIDEDLWVGTPSNHAICKALASDLGDDRSNVLFGRHARKAEFRDDHWQVSQFSTPTYSRSNK